MTTKKTIDILRSARSSLDAERNLAAVDHLLQAGYPPERAQRATSRYPQGHPHENLEDLIGKTLVRIERNPAGTASELIFEAATGERYRMWYEQDCCANAYIEDIVGDLNDLLGTPILMAESVTDRNTPAAEESTDSYTWTFYKLATIKGYVTIRWYGSSNGYYCEEASFARIRE